MFIRQLLHTGWRPPTVLFRSLFTSIKTLPQSLSLRLSVEPQLIAAEKIRQSSSATIEDKNDTLFNLLKAMSPEIRLHASRRVDLFFWLLVAVYNTQAKVSRLPTVRGAPGGSVAFGTHACHSSLFPHVRLILPLQQVIDVHALNSTVELPQAVNGFDGHLEGRRKPSPLVHSALGIVHQVSQGELCPRSGVNHFLRVLQTTLKLTPSAYFFKNSPTSTSMAKLLIREYQLCGSLQNADKLARQVTDEYIQSRLRLNAEEIEALKSEPDKIKEYYAETQRVLLTASVHP